VCDSTRASEVGVEKKEVILAEILTAELSQHRFKENDESPHQTTYAVRIQHTVNRKSRNLSTMRTAVLAAVVASVGLAVSGVTLPQKSVVVVYGPDTPNSIVQQAKDAIIAAVSGPPLILWRQLM
jgi:hypothetical protein